MEEHKTHLQEEATTGGAAQATQKISFLATEYELKVRQALDATKLYFQSIVVLGAGVGAGITALATLKEWQSVVATVAFAGMPFFLLSWFGCFLFIYWDHHMMRVSLDYTDKTASEILGISPDKVFLYHEDFLGVFNQADFLTRSAWFPVTIKSVQVVFVSIGFPGALIFGYSGYRAFILINQFHGAPMAWLYTAVLAALLLILVSIHLNCVRRERFLKKSLRIVSKWEAWNKELRISRP